MEGEIEAIEEALVEETPQVLVFLRELGLALVYLAAGALLVFLIWHYSRIINKHLEDAARKIKPLHIKKLRLLSGTQIAAGLGVLLRVLRVVFTAILAYLTLALVFSPFPQTQGAARLLLSLIWTPFKNIVLGIAHYLPNLFTILVTLVVIHYVVKLMRFFSTEIGRGKLVLKGFYPDWAKPTFNILRAILYIFALAVIYPLLPGSDSPVFQGVSIIAGLLVSFGSSTAVGNLVAGIVMTYMRPFKIGDRIKIGNEVGFVVEKTMMVIRIRTHKNEYITFPNTMILNSAVVNYDTSIDSDKDSLILYAEITFGYSTPWETIHRILIDAALKTEGVLAEPRPFVLETALDDFYCRYQINVHTRQVERTPAIYSALFENIQLGFRAEGLDMTAAHYYAGAVGGRDQ
jgi:small-conductance mechanosensitive channel